MGFRLQGLKAYNLELLVGQLARLIRSGGRFWCRGTAVFSVGSGTVKKVQLFLKMVDYVVIENLLLSAS